MKKLGIIVPYRDRKQHLDCFLPSIHSALEDQGIYDYQIIVVEQTDKDPFNRGALLNLGALEAIKQGCTELCFHDVDLIPVDVDYGVSAGDWPVELVKEVQDEDSEDHSGYNYLGGAALVRADVFKDVDGYSNKYEGWGYEDDDFLLRLQQKGHVSCATGFQTPLTFGRGQQFPGKYVVVPCSSPKETDKVLLIVDFIPELPTKNVGTRDMKVLSIQVGKGMECGISYDRYGSYRFDTWDSGYVYHCLVSEKRPTYHSRIVVEINLDTREFSMYHNGEYYGTEYLGMKRRFVFSPQELHVGFSINDNTEFEGTVLEAGMVYSSNTLTEDQGRWLSLERLNLKEILGKDIKEFWATLDRTVDVNYGEVTEVPVPCKPVKGLFRHLAHKKNSTTSSEVVQNQERFYKVSRGMIEEKEGLSTVESLYTTETSKYGRNVTWVKAIKL